MFNVIFESGELCHDDIDFELPGLIPVIFDRSYLSSRRKSGRLGYGWSWPWEIALRIERDFYVLDIDNGTIQETFEKKKLIKGEIISDSGSKLTIFPDHITIKRTDEFTYYFLHLDRIQNTVLVVIIEDVCGNRLLFNNKNSRLVELTDADNRKFRISYDISGRVICIDIVQGYVPNCPPRLVTYEYDSAGDLVRIIDRCGVVTEYHYVDHLLVALRNRTGGWFFAQYDKKRRCVSKWRGDNRLLVNMQFDDVRGHVLVTDALGYSTLYRVNENGQVVEEIEANGNCIRSIYDQGGGLLATMNQSGANTFVNIEISDTEQKVTMVDASGTMIVQKIDLNTGTRQLVDASGGIWKRKYNESNLLVYEKSPLAAVKSYKYDPNGVLIAITEPNGNTIRCKYSPDYRSVTIYDDLGELESLRWDSEGRLIECRMALCTPEEFYYDPLGRLIGIKHPNGSYFRFILNKEGEPVGFVDELGDETVLEHSPYGELLSVIDPSGDRFSWKYDVLGQVVRIRNAVNEQMTFEYDPLGNIISQRFFDGRFESYSYNSLGHLKGICHSDGSVTQLEYDGGGRILRVVDSDRQVSVFEYDEQGRCILADGAGVAVQFEYDAESNCIMEDQGGIRLEREFDALGNCVILTVEGLGARKFGYDKRDRLTELIDFDGSRFQFDYDLRDRCVAIRAPDGARFERAYFPYNRLSACRLVRGVVTTEVRYKYDNAGRVVEREMSDRSIVKYEYDSAGRLSGQVLDGIKLDFEFNGVDDLLKNSKDTPILYRHGSIIEKSGEITFEHDRRGRMVARRDKTGKTTFYYDGHDQLVRAIRPDKSESRYVYDALGRRLQKLFGSAQIRFIWNEDQIVAETSNNAAEPNALYLMDWETFIPISMVRDGKRGLFIADSVGYPLLFDAGHTRFSDEPHPWGVSALSRNEAAFQPLRFAGQYADVETGLYYNRHRYYDPDSGRYLTPDPIGINSSTNLYSYVSDPINSYDSIGLQVEVTERNCRGGRAPQPRQRPTPARNVPCNDSRGASIHNHCINMLREMGLSRKRLGGAVKRDQAMNFGSGNNRPDVFLPGLGRRGKDVYVEFDYHPARRAQGHLSDICANHPGAMVYLVTIPKNRVARFSRTTTGRTTRVGGSLRRRRTDPGSRPVRHRDCGIDKIPI